jgi:ketosteroid isomerase-like protein
MTSHHRSDQTRVRELIENWTRAVSSVNREAILAHHAPNVLNVRLPASCYERAR